MMAVFTSIQPDWMTRVQAVVTGSRVSATEGFLKKVCEAELK